jgi:hypothetical protein
MKMSYALRFAGAALLGALALSVSARANAPAGHYAASNGVVVDRKTGLSWQQVAPTIKYTWPDAMTYCGGLSAMLGGSGWRLPAIKELQSLVDDTITPPSIDTSANGFPGTATDAAYWSATTIAGMPTFAWWVFFGGIDDTTGAPPGNTNGGITNGDAMSVPHYIRCVR